MGTVCLVLSALVIIGIGIWKAVSPDWFAGANLGAGLLVGIAVILMITGALQIRYAYRSKNNLDGNHLDGL